MPALRSARFQRAGSRGFQPRVSRCGAPGRAVKANENEFPRHFGAVILLPIMEEAFLETFQRVVIWLAAICLPLTALAVETAPAPAASTPVTISVSAPAPSYEPLTNLTFDAETKVYEAKL